MPTCNILDVASASSMRRVDLGNKAQRTAGLQRALLLIEEVTQEAVDQTI